MTDFQVILRNPNGDEYELTNATDVWWLDELNEPSQAGFALNIAEMMADAFEITLCYTQLYLYRNGEAVFGGVIQAEAINSQDRKSVFTADDWFWMLIYRLVGTNLAPVNYTNEDSSDIVNDLIVQAMTLSDMGLVAGTLAVSSPHDRTLLQFEPLLKTIQGLSNNHIADGVDVEISPDKRYSTWYPRRGELKPSIIFELGINILSWRVSRNGRTMANDITALGAGQGESMVTAHAASPMWVQTSYGLRQDAPAYKSVSEPDTLQGHANSDLADRQAVKEVLSISVDASLEPVYGTYNLGDIVPVKIVDGRVKIDSLQRIYGRLVKRGNDGAEVVSLTLNAA